MPAVFISVDDGSLDGLRAKTKALRAEYRALNKEVLELRTTGQQVSRELADRMEKARTVLAASEKELKTKKTEIKESREEFHEAHFAERTAHQAMRIISSQFAYKLANGEIPNVKDSLHAAIQDEKFVMKIAKRMGADDETIMKFGKAVPVLQAALMGWEIGSIIRERIDERAELKSHLENENKPQALRDLVNGEGFFSNAGKLVENVEKFSQAAASLEGSEVGQALVAYRRTGEGSSPSWKEHLQKK